MSAPEAETVCHYCAGVQAVTTHIRHITQDGRELAPGEHTVKPCPVCAPPPDMEG